LWAKVDEVSEQCILECEAQLLDFAQFRLSARVCAYSRLEPKQYRRMFRPIADAGHPRTSAPTQADPIPL
jgi:hypothetical protein